MSESHRDKARRVLKELTELVTEPGFDGDHVRYAVWGIVTGLRGPDSADEDEAGKKMSTAHVRGALLHFAGRADAANFDSLPGIAAGYPERPLSCEVLKDSFGAVVAARQANSSLPDHFTDHLERAVRGLQQLGIVDAEGHVVPYVVPVKEGEHA